jgi:hypothetical protein
LLRAAEPTREYKWGQYSSECKAEKKCNSWAIKEEEVRDNAGKPSPNQEDINRYKAGAYFATIAGEG